MNKPERYVVLDALRGVAATAVFAYHLTTALGLPVAVTAGYRAVDFFFVLSGLIVASAYEDALLNGMTFVAFTKIRLIRLYPLAFLSVMLVLVFWSFFALKGVFGICYYGPLSEVQKYLAVAFALLILPAPRVSGLAIFFLNPPMWSLWMELWINCLYGFFVRLLSAKVLVSLACVSFMIIGIYLLENNGIITEQLGEIFPRVLYSFSIGILIYRLLRADYFSKVPAISGWWLGLILIISCVLHENYMLWLQDLIIAYILYPLVIVLGTRSVLHHRFIPLANWLGRISYPLYILHVPIMVNVIWLMNYYDQPVWACLLVNIVAVFISSIVASEFFDIPVRAWLRHRFERRLIHQALKP